MNKKKSILLLLSIIILLSNCKVNNRVKHVVLITIDGARPEYYMDSSWPATLLQELKHKGVYAPKGAKTIFPSITVPAHASIITGTHPLNHGIYYNSPFEGRLREYLYYESFKSKTLWEAIKEAGMTSGSVYWPGTADAPIDYNFPALHPEKGEKGNQFTVTYPYIRPQNLLLEIEKETGIKIDANDFSKENCAHSKMVTEISKHIIRKHKPNLMTIHFLDTDYYQHKYGTDSPIVKNVVQITDSLIGTILNSIKYAGIEKSTVVIIMGDHGHRNIKATFAPNVYLTEHGLIEDNDWKAKFNEGFLHLKNENDLSTLELVISIIKELPEYKRGDFKLLDRNDLDKMGANPNTPIALAMKDGIVVSNRISGKGFELHKGTPKSTHGWDPSYQSMHTAFLIFGPRIKRNKTINGVEIVDIAPLITHLLQLDLNTHDGKLLSDIITN